MLWALVRNLFRPRSAQSTGIADAAGPVTEKSAPDTCADLLKQADSLVAEGKLAAALEAYRVCAKAYPQALDARLGAAGVLMDLWSVDEAIAEYAAALQLAPTASVVFSALLFHSHYRSPADAQRMFDLHRQYGVMMRQVESSRHAGPAPAATPGRRLRIGYISPNFSRHSVGYFVEPVIRAHDRDRYEIFCYYSHRLADDTTERIRQLADGWRDVASAGDAALESLIRADGIDILIDLAGHSKGNRLSTIALKPAPVQMTWLGYPDTTGLAAVDFRITDATADPAPAADGRHTEQLLRMDCFLCYQPPADSPPVALRDPAAAVVFSSFNNIAKLNAQTLRMWGTILAAVAGSRLVLKAAALGFPDTVDRLLDACERNGIDPSRVELRGWITGRGGHLGHYDEVDIALDTCPYNGTTTTCEALWMGVPVITLAGDAHMSRVGASILRAVGLANLVAESDTQYAQIALALAQDRSRRVALRAGMRDRLRASPLLDHAGFTRQLEQHYWQAWCDLPRQA